MKTKINAEQSGQALVELGFALILLCVFVCGVIDFARAVYDIEVMENLAAEGSAMASRSTPSEVATAAQAVVTDAGSDLNMSTNGCVIISAVGYNASALQVTNQVSQCGTAISATSKVGSTGSSATIPASAVSVLNAESTGAQVYVTEVFYNYSPWTPIMSILGKNILPSPFYTAAYY